VESSKKWRNSYVIITRYKGFRTAQTDMTLGAFSAGYTIEVRLTGASVLLEFGNHAPEVDLDNMRIAPKTGGRSPPDVHH